MAQPAAQPPTNVAAIAAGTATGAALLIVAAVVFAQTASVEDPTAPAEVILVSRATQAPSATSAPSRDPIRLSMQYSPLEMGFVTDQLRIGNSDQAAPLVVDPGSPHVTLPAADCQFIRCGAKSRMLDQNGRVLASVRNALASDVRITDSSNDREVCVVSACRCGEEPGSLVVRQQCERYRYVSSSEARVPPHTMQRKKLTYGSQANEVASVVENAHVISTREILRNLLVFPAYEIKGKTGSSILGMCCTHADDPRLVREDRVSFSSTFLNACWRRNGGGTAEGWRRTEHVWCLHFSSTSAGECVMGAPSGEDLRRWGRVMARMPFLVVANTPILKNSIGGVGDSYYITTIDAFGLRRRSSPASDTRWWRYDPKSHIFPRYLWLDLGTNVTLGSPKIGAYLSSQMGWVDADDVLIFEFGEGRGSLEWDPRSHWDEARRISSMRVSEGLTLSDIEQRFGHAPILMLGMRMMCANAPQTYIFDFDQSEIRVMQPR